MTGIAIQSNASQPGAAQGPLLMAGAAKPKRFASTTHLATTSGASVTKDVGSLARSPVYSSRPRAEWSIPSITPFSALRLRNSMVP